MSFIHFITCCFIILSFPFHSTVSKSSNAQSIFVLILSILTFQVSLIHFLIFSIISSLNSALNSFLPSIVPKTHFILFISPSLSNNSSNLTSNSISVVLEALIFILL